MYIYCIFFIYSIYNITIKLKRIFKNEIIKCVFAYSTQSMVTHNRLHSDNSPLVTCGSTEAITLVSELFSF